MMSNSGSVLCYVSLCLLIAEILFFKKEQIFDKEKNCINLWLKM